MITTKTPFGSLELWAGPLTIMAMMLAVEVFGDAGRAALQYHRGLIAEGQWWRFLTGNLAHLGWYHWALNTLGMIVLVLLCPDRLSPLVWARRLVLLGLGMTAGLWFFAPDLRTYVGMSGVIHGFFVLGLMPQVLKKDLIAAGCLAYLLGKIGWEMFFGAPVSDAEAIGGMVAVESHLFGSLAAFIYGLAFRTFWRPERIGNEKKGKP